MSNGTSPLVVQGIILQDPDIISFHSRFKEAAQALLVAYPKDADGEPLYGPKKEVRIPVGDTDIHFEIPDAENPYQAIEVAAQSIEYWPGDVVEYNDGYLITESELQDFVQTCKSLVVDVERMPIPDSVKAGSLTLFSLISSEVESLQSHLQSYTLQVPDHPTVFLDDMVSMSQTELGIVQKLIHELQYWGHINSHRSPFSDESELWVGMIYGASGSVTIQIYSYHIDFGSGSSITEFDSLSSVELVIERLESLCEIAKRQTILRYPDLLN